MHKSLMNTYVHAEIPDTNTYMHTNHKKHVKTHTGRYINLHKIHTHTHRL